MKNLLKIIFTTIVYIYAANFVSAQISSDGTMDGISLERNSVYQSKGLTKISGTLWQTDKLFEINYGNHAFRNSEGMTEFASLGFSDPIISGETLYYRLYPAPLNTFIAAMDAKNGKLLWSYKSKEQLSNPVLAGETIYFVSEDKNIYAFDAKTGKEKWTFGEKNTKWNVFNLSPIVADGILYTSTADGKLFAVDVNSQKPNWIFEAKGLLSPVVFSKDNLYVGDEKGNVFSLDKQGKQIWTFKAKGQVRTLVFADDSIFFRTDNGELYSLSASDGKLNWNTKIGGKFRYVFPISSIQIGSALGFYNKTIFFTGEEKGDSFLFAVNAKDGQPKWKLKIEEPTRNPVLSNGMIYFGSLGKLYAVDSENGNLLWANEYKSNFEGSKVKNVVSSPAVSENNLFVISDEGIVYSYK